MKIRKIQKKDTSDVALLIFNTFKNFNSKDFFDKKSVEKYLDLYDVKKNSLDNLFKIFQKSEIFYVALNNNKIVGMIRGDVDKIINLYVDSCFHKIGIGRKLVSNFEKEARNKKSKTIKINSSIYAISFYEKIGYKKSTGIRNFRGIKVCPMKKNINH